MGGNSMSLSWKRAGDKSAGGERSRCRERHTVQEGNLE